MLTTVWPRVFNEVTRAGAWVAGASLCAIVVAYMFEIIARSLFDAPTRWVADTVSYLMCAAVFLALPRVTAARAHISVTLLLDRLPGRWAVGGARVIALAGAVVCLVVGCGAAIETHRQWVAGIETVATVPIAKAYLSACIAFGFTLSGLCFGAAALRRAQADALTDS